MSEEQQGRNMAMAARDAGAQCFIWSTMPSSIELSGGRLATRVYEGTLKMHNLPRVYVYSYTGKHQVDAYIRELGLRGVFLYTGNFYENMVLRGHMSYNKETDIITFKQPIIKPDAQRISTLFLYAITRWSRTVTMLYVEKDLSAIVKAVFDQWEKQQNELNGKYLQASNARVRPVDIVSSVEKGKVPWNEPALLEADCSNARVQQFRERSVST
jgi:NmrA-like family